VESAKLFIERRYAKLIQQERDKKVEWEQLYKKMQSLNMSDDEQ
jgi:serine/threonine kinase 38